MSKLLVETTGEFALLCPEDGGFIPHNRPAVVIRTNFLQSRIAAGQLKVYDTPLSDEATEEEFIKFYTEADGDSPLAVQSFLAAFKAEDAANPAKPKSAAKVK